MTPAPLDEFKSETVAELSKLFAHAKGVAASLISETGYAAAQLLAAVKSSRSGPCQLLTSRLELDFNNDEDCHAAMHAWGSCIGEQRGLIMAASIISQSWSCQRLDLGDVVLPKGHPDRQDVVMVSAVSSFYKTAAAIAYLYSPNPNITAECWQDLEQNYQHFMLLKRMYEGWQVGQNKSKPSGN